MENPVQRLAACVLSALVLVLLGAPASQASSESLRYVALGDSYSAASGVLPPDPEAPLSCLRSTSNYPHLIAAETGAELTDVTCGGADTTDYFSAQYDGVPPQLDALDAETELVTMTIGGNDSGVFINSIVQCGTAGASTLGQGSPCKDRYGSSFEDTIRTTTYPSLVNALQAVRDKAPDAQVAILSYPWILPTSGGCFDKMPVAEGDVPYLRSLQTTLNDAVRRAAEVTGATYVDMNEVSEGHDACQPLGVRWIEPVLQGTNAVVVHPNALGEQQMAAQAMTALGLGDAQS
jgi:lysophospholipase L1-like esterase